VERGLWLFRLRFVCGGLTRCGTCAWLVSAKDARLGCALGFVVMSCGVLWCGFLCMMGITRVILAQGRVDVSLIVLFSFSSVLFLTSDVI